MSVSIDWGNPDQTYLVQTFMPGWTWQDFYEVSQQAVDLMQSVDHPVHLISNFRQSGKLPVGSSAITHARNVMKKYPDNWGLLIVVSDSLFIRSMVKAFRRLFVTGIGSKTYATETIDEAYLMLSTATPQLI